MACSSVLAAALAVSAVGCGSGKKGGSDKGKDGAAEEIKDLVTFEVPNREMENVFVLNTEMSNDLKCIFVIRMKVFLKQMKKVNSLPVSQQNGVQKTQVLHGHSN